MPDPQNQKILMVDVRRGYEDLRGEIDRAVLETLASGEYCLGSQCEAFEREVAAYLGVPHAIGLSSGTDALLLALTDLGVKPGDEVIAPAFTFIATATGIARLGARPVFADIQKDGFQMDPDALAAAITPRTRAVIPVHLYGSPAPMARYEEVIAASGHSIPIVEDACQAMGSIGREGRSGTIGVWGCFSFYPTKNLAACGDAGLMVTREAERAERARRLRAHGMESSRLYHHTLVGINARLDGIQAAILRVRLRDLDRANLARAENASRYRKAFEESGILARFDSRSRAPSLRIFRAPGPGEFSNNHQFPVLAARRDELKAHLFERGIQSAVFYPTPLPFQPAFSGLGYRAGEFPASEALARDVLCLPVHPYLTTGDVDRVAGEIVRFYS